MEGLSAARMLRRFLRREKSGVFMARPS
jgi:hypothetical protein